MDPCPLCGTVATRVTTSAGEVVRCACTAGAPTARGSGAWQSWRRNVAHRAAGKAPDSKHTTDVSPGEIDDTPETRTAHIASKIAECAKSLKREPCDLTWEDFRAYGSIAWGANTLGIVRRDITRLGGFNAIRDSHFAKREATEQGLLKKRVFEHANVNRKLARFATDDEFEFRRIEEFTERVFKGRIKPIPSHGRKKCAREIDRELVLCFGDPHIGGEIVAEETGGPSFSVVEEARSMAYLVKQAVEWKPEYRDKTAMNLVLLGDMIQGDLHETRDGAVISEQISRAIHLIIQAVAHLAAAFTRVSVVCVTGNHGRDTARHHGRAIVQKWDSRETVIYSACHFATERLGNVTWHIPRAPFAVFELFGKRYYVTHGDTVIKTGNPGKSINTAAIESDVNRLNATLQNRDKYAVIIAGHVHQQLYLPLSNGTDVVVNGAFTPIGPHALSISVFESVCKQAMFEAVAGHPVGDYRPLTLDPTIYADQSLDKIIAPWAGF